MYQNSRPTVEAFADSEMLYFRVDSNGFTEKGEATYHIEPDAVRPPDQSVNRHNGTQQFGQPEDVLWDSHFGIHHTEDGVAEIPVSAIPERLEVEDSPIVFSPSCYL